MNTLKTIAITVWLSASICCAEVSHVGFDLPAIRNPATLETRVIEDWKPAPKEPAVRQKLIEITVCEWWSGQKIRLPVTLNAPSSGAVCRNLIVDNMGMGLKPALPTGAALRLLKEKGVGVVLIGTGEIAAMTPDGKLHVGMKQHLLKTRDPRFTPAWLWGISHMRALTAAMVESDVFQPAKVLATGGSKRGMAAIAAGIHDDRFTAIVPIVASPFGSPSGPYVLGTGSPEVSQANERFFADLAAGRRPGMPDTAAAALKDRQKRQADVRITVGEARHAGWSAGDITDMNERAWDTIRVTSHLDALRRRGFELFYIVGSNDNANPWLVELGQRHPDFPIYIVPGGQHGGPTTTGFTLQVPTLPATQENLQVFARHHFFGTPKLPAAPRMERRLDPATRRLAVTVVFPDGAEPEDNKLWWSVNRHPPASLPFEYDPWQSMALRKIAPGTYAGEATYPHDARTIDFVSTHRHLADGSSFRVSSAMQKVETGPASADVPAAQSGAR